MGQDPGGPPVGVGGGERIYENCRQCKRKLGFDMGFERQSLGLGDGCAATQRQRPQVLLTATQLKLGHAHPTTCAWLLPLFVPLCCVLDMRM